MTASTRSVRWDPDRLAQLEEERDLLLRDLRELDTQHLDGEIDAPKYQALRDDLTARAADAITLIERGKLDRPPKPARAQARFFAIAGIIVVAGLAGLLLSDQLAPRVPPAPPAAQEAGSEARIARLAAVVDARPDDVPARLALARLLLLEQDLEGALGQFDAVTELDPSHAEALTYAGWLATLQGDISGGLQRLDRAVAADPVYPDAHALRGLTLMRSEDRAAALEELRHYLELAPNGPLAGQVQAVIERLESGS